MGYETTMPLGIPENIFRELVSMNDVKKLNVIKFLAESLSVPAAKVEDEKSYTRRMLDKHAGKWVGDESADDIMQTIREHSSIREPLTF